MSKGNIIILIYFVQALIRIKNSVSDIDRCIEHGHYYMDNHALYDANSFRFHNGLVNLIDTIRDNNFGIFLSVKQVDDKIKLCDELIIMVEKLIIVNNKLKDMSS